MGRNFSHKPRSLDIFDLGDGRRTSPKSTDKRFERFGRARDLKIDSSVGMVFHITEKGVLQCLFLDKSPEPDTLYCSRDPDCFLDVFSWAECHDKRDL